MGRLMQKKRLRTTLGAALVTMLVSVSPAAAETARVRAPVSLLATPSTSAAPTGAAKAGVTVQVLDRRGFWAKVSVGGASGWVKLSALSLSNANSGREIASLASGRSGQGNVVSTSGGRGLDNGADLTKGTPNPAAVAALSGLAVSQDDAERFARAGHLVPRTLPYTAAPKEGASQ
jgi:uncharacterized protein YraI